MLNRGAWLRIGAWLRFGAPVVLVIGAGWGTSAWSQTPDARPDSAAAGAAGNGSSPKTPEKSLAETLAERTNLDLIDTPLSEALEYLAVMHPVRFVVDTRAVEQAGIDMSQIVTIGLRGVRLEMALSVLLEHRGLDWVVRDDVLWITTKDEAEKHLETRVWDVADLLTGEGVRFEDERDLDSDAESLAAAIVSVVAPSSWEEQGGPGSMHYFNGTLVVKHNRRVLGSVERLLRDMRDLRRQRSAADKKAEQAAAAADPGRWEVVTYRVLTPTQLATGGGRDPSLALLSAAGTAAALPGSPEGAVQAAARAVTEQKADMERAAAFCQQMAETITATIAPESWEARGGLGVIRAVPGAVIVKQTPGVHGQIRRLLAPLAPAHDGAPAETPAPSGTVGSKRGSLGAGIF